MEESKDSTAIQNWNQNPWIEPLAGTEDWTQGHYAEQTRCVPEESCSKHTAVPEKAHLPVPTE